MVFVYCPHLIDSHQENARAAEDFASEFVQYLVNHLLIHVWHPKPSETSVGHVMTVDSFGDVATSNFPTPHGIRGDNTAKSFEQTIAIEKRPADAIFEIRTNPTQDLTVANIARQHRERPMWFALPLHPLETNCSISSNDILKAVVPGFRAFSPIAPNPLSVFLGLSVLSKFSETTGVTRLK